MNIYQIIVIIIAAVFTLLWTYQARIKLYYSNINVSTLSIVGVWWIFLVLAILKVINPLHLIWIFPIVVVVMPILYFKIPGFVYPSFGFYMPCFLINSMLKSLLTIIPPKNVEIIKKTRTIVSNLTEIISDTYLNDNIKNDIEQLLISSIRKYKNVDTAMASSILEKSHNYNPNAGDSLSLSGLCTLFVFEEYYAENKKEPNISERLTIKKTIINMLDDWFETMNRIESLVTKQNK
jgi:hypothetical protein